MINLHILYEYSREYRPHSSAFIRLLRPFCHPLNSNRLNVTWGRYLPSHPVDVVIVDRLWHPYDIDQASASMLVKDIKQKGAKLLYAFDDHFEEWIKEKPRERLQHSDVFRTFLDSSDGILVTTKMLADQYTSQHPNPKILPNMLDERLVARRSILQRSNERIVIGYMGTPTHDEDLEIILPALAALHKSFPDQVLFEFIGALGENVSDRFPILKKIPVHIWRLNPQQVEYPLFMLWYSSTINWDIAIAFLQDTPFNQCKSDIKFLDYAAVGCAGIFSDATPYQNISHGKTGLLVRNDPSEWIEALTQLIVDTNLRYRIQKNAVDYLFNERVLRKTAQSWLNVIESLLQ